MAALNYVYAVYIRQAFPQSIFFDGCGGKKCTNFPPSDDFQVVWGKGVSLTLKKECLIDIPFSITDFISADQDGALMPMNT